MKDEFMTGVNYWPIEAAMDWWHCFDPGVVKEDFSRIREAGLKGVRIFLLWEDFQPLPKKVSVKALEELVSVMDMAHERELQILLTLFTGHMSGMNYLPPWMLESRESETRFPVFSEGRVRKNAIRNFYADREVREAQKLLVREVAGALQGYPSLWAWDLGNEPSNLAIPSSQKEALIWLEEMVSELKKRGESIPVTLGLHQEDLEEDRKMGPKEVASFCDFLSMHTYSIYAKWAKDPLDEDVTPFLGLLTQWLGSKKVLIEEVGVSSSNGMKGELIVSEDQAFDYYERLLPRLGSFDFLGVFFWCYGDYAKTLWEKPPFHQKKHERYFGLFHEDRRPKSYVSLLKDFHVPKKEKSSVSLDWIGIEPEEYFQDPGRHLTRLYLQFKDQGL